MSDLPKLGIDIGSVAIKLVELSPLRKDKWKLATAISAATPGSGIGGGQGDLLAVTAVLVKMIKESGAKARKAVVALPEEQVSSHIVEMPLLSDAEVKQALKWQVEQYIPIPEEKAVWSHQVIKRDEAGGGMEVLLVAASKSLVNSAVAVLEKAGLEVVAIETELTAAARAEVAHGYPLSMVVDIGAKSTDLGVVREGQLVFSRTIPTGGEGFTRAIESGLGMERSQAEQYRNTYGFAGDKLGGKLVEVMRPVLVVVGNEVKKTADFYTSKHPGETVKLVTLSGGMAVVPELAGVLSGMVGMEVAIGNPLLKVVTDAKRPKISPIEGPFYAVAIGLAMREL
ncbi:hypothetical protein A3H89_05050 [Candidatus Amesbacteria bacterium RIFCSPLOWO2_02_FULL_48_11]|uniref:SHS2 domain-containing protein n=4 Tax=Candidatus Amesiibacteriota TaxID=1752730 RepID=A0A1F4Z661_9BACT|nr:MAG: Type IV pilus assembly protein PilM [Candidatus Amesbacteria bacterium GW2011_GWA2_47_11]KKU94192.1 MAG: Type IV pilus assembly protein PilM [Candidatus Amesbacteria bacterium GW2011_GWC1_48_10]KKW00494.1 MAG: Type IV pilus assembly protein PilM [Candidatus Amesbacteria bacterium GW2011_GWA1_48_9]OGC89095.1 MAG: hypothetical protein A2V48_01845 [Candidatus Amesbacteria bacterium RBG_19FT_COMBO_48_16]OGC95361.1 MAG: hypothetical protein A3C34_04810 [Candidatus Amesbacteria bacterium RIFC